MSTSNKHQLDEPDVLQPNRRPKQPDHSRLSIDHAFKKRALGGLKKHELWEIFFEIGQLGLKNALAQACLHHLRPGCAALQTRYHKLSYNNVSQAEKIIKQDNIPRPKVKVCAKAIRTFEAIQIACRANGNMETFLESVKLGAAYFSILLSIEGEKANEHIPDSRDRFLALIEILEQHEPETKTGAQIDSTPGPSHQSIQAAAPAPAYKSSQAAAPDLTSDDYLQARVLQCQVTLQDDITGWDLLLGLEDVKTELESTMVTLLLDRDAPGSHRLKMSPPGVLLHGPPGCGKTSIAYSFAKKFKLPLFRLMNLSISREFCGESARTLTRLFDHLRAIGPCVLLMSEVSDILQSPGQNVANSVVLVQIQAHLKMLWSRLMMHEAPVFIIGTTNNPWRIEMKDFRRNFSTVEYVGLPDDSTRQGLWKQGFADYYSNIGPSELEEIVAETAGYSAYDINRLLFRIQRDLTAEVTEAKGFRNATFNGETFLVPASEAPFDVVKEYQDLSERERGIVMHKAIQASMIYEEIESGDFRTVSEESIKRHETWQAAMTHRQ